MRFSRPVLLILACMAAPLRAGIVTGNDEQEEENQQYQALPKLRVAVDGGFSYWVYNPDNLTNDFEDFIHELDRGTAASGQAVFYPWPKGGFGGEWIWFLSHASGTGLKLDNAGNTLYTRTERASFVYWGATFCSRLKLKETGILQANFGGGYLDILDTWKDNGEPTKVTAHNFALVTGLSGDWYLTRQLGLGITGRFLFSNVREYVLNGKKYHTQDFVDPYTWSNIPMYRLEATVGLRFYL
jgi:hypothetical protein